MKYLNILNYSMLISAEIVGVQQSSQEEASDLFSSSDMHLDSMSCLEQARYVEKRLDATSALLAEAVHSSGSTGTPKSVRKGPRFSTPLRDSSASLSALGRSGGPGTPAARPLNWLVQQANSEVKGLRARAEKLQWNIPEGEEEVSQKKKDTEGEEVCDKENLGSNQHNTTPPRNEEGGRSIGGLQKKSSSLEVRTLQRQLNESMNIIFEMDRLVHAALVGNLSSSLGGSGRSSTGGLNYAEEDGVGDDDAQSDDEAEFDMAGVGRKTPGYKFRGSYDPSEWSVGDLLPSGE